MRHMTRKISVTLALAALGLLSFLAAADATTTTKIPSHTTIHSHGLTFHGKVTSSNPNCRDGRHVTLHRTNGDILGHAVTNSHGKWKITASGSAGISLGRFYATAPRVAFSTNPGHIFVCKRARSKTIPLQ
jgi:hypothetical protein